MYVSRIYKKINISKINNKFVHASVLYRRKNNGNLCENTIKSKEYYDKSQEDVGVVLNLSIY